MFTVQYIDEKRKHNYSKRQHLSLDIRACIKILLLIVIFFIHSPLFSKEVSILLIRHGETDWNVEKKVQGQTDIPLNSTGETQAKTIGEKLKREHADIKAIYSSDLSRAYFTAYETAERLNLPIEIRCSLREINTGTSEGMKTAEKIALYKEKFNELNIKYPNKRDRWNYSPIPGEETINELISRIKGELIRISQASSNNEKVVVFSHGKAIKAFIADIEDKNMEEIDQIPNGKIIKVLYNSENCLHPFQLIQD
jgi:broad specificity phosphatase PhoE